MKEWSQSAELYVEKKGNIIQSADYHVEEKRKWCVRDGGKQEVQCQLVVGLEGGNIKEK